MGIDSFVSSFSHHLLNTYCVLNPENRTVNIKMIFIEPIVLQRGKKKRRILKYCDYYSQELSKCYQLNIT